MAKNLFVGSLPWSVNDEADEEGAKKAIDTLNGKEIDGRAITVNEARPREER